MARRTEALFGPNGGKAEGWRAREGDAPAVEGTRQQKSISHVGGGGGHTRLGGCTQWHCYEGGGGMQLIRFGEMDHSLKSSPWEALTENTPVTVSWLFLEAPLKQAMDQSFITVFIHTERKCLFLRP